MVALEFEAPHRRKSENIATVRQATLSHRQFLKIGKNSIYSTLECSQVLRKHTCDKTVLTTVTSDSTPILQTYIIQNGTIVTGLILFLLRQRTLHNFLPVLFVFSVGSFQFEHFNLTGSGM